MVSKYAVIDNGIVANVIMAEGLIAGLVMVQSDSAAPGDLYSAEVFTRPAPVVAVPQAVTMRQARLVLLGAGKLAQVNSAIAGMTGAQGEAARIEWEFSSEVKRAQLLVMAMGQVLGMTDAQLDSLFIAAAAL